MVRAILRCWSLARVRRHPETLPRGIFSSPRAPNPVVVSYVIGSRLKIVGRLQGGTGPNQGGKISMRFFDRNPFRGRKARNRVRGFAPRAGVALAMSAIALAVVPLATTSASATASTKPVLTVGIDQPPQSLNPAKDDTGTNLIIHALSDETLIHINSNGTYSPGLATSWKYVGTGNKTFEFTLRDDARFSDGTPVTAQAVKVWLNYFEHADGPFVSDFGPISSITTSGKWTVVLHLGAPNPDVPYFLSEALFNWGFVEAPSAVAHPATLGTTTDGAGPYELVASQTVSGSVYTFKPNPYYYDSSAIKWSKVVVKVISTPATMLSALESGQLDVAQGDVSTASAAKAAGFNVLSAPDGTVHILFLDRAGTLDPALGNVEVRQALNLILNGSTPVLGVVLNDARL